MSSCFNTISKIVVCPDSFKGSLTSSEAAGTICEGLRLCGFNGEIVSCPLSDGGEGFLDVLSDSVSLEWVKIDTVNAASTAIRADYCLDNSTGDAYIESARIIGLDLIELPKRNPLETTSFGLGNAIKDAIGKGARNIYISLGGSATCDGGMGMLCALGVIFSDCKGRRLEGNGRNLSLIASIAPSNLIKEVKQVRFHILSDVINPLLGDEGAVNVFAPQKGASDADLPILEQGMANLVHQTAVSGIAPAYYSDRPGAGAAGGLGYALMSYLRAECQKGIEFIMEKKDFKCLINDADMIITGEGSIDRQSLMGKVAGTVLAKATYLKKPVVAFAGRVTDKEALLSAGFPSVYEISDQNLTLEENMHKTIAKKNLIKSVAVHMKDIVHATCTEEL